MRRYGPTARLRFAVTLLLIAAMFGACQFRPTADSPTSSPETTAGNTPGTTASTSARPETPTPTPTLDQGSTGGDSPCQAISPAAVPPLEKLTAAAQPPPAQGAGGDEEDEDNEGGKPPTPPDPASAVESNPDLPQSAITPPAAQGDEKPSDIVLFQPITSVGNSSLVAEPNVAVHGETVLMTWNKGVAQSSDGNATHTYLDPWKAMTSPDGTTLDGGFCCDQLAQYVDKYDLWVWVLQAKTRLEGHAGGNRLRLMVAKGNGTFDSAYDLISTELAFNSDGMYDQPKMGASDGHLFVSVNAFSPDPPGGGHGHTRGTVVYRLSLDDLANNVPTTPDCFSTENQLDTFGYPYFGAIPLRTAGETMYLAAHDNISTLAVWRWPDNASSPTMVRANQSTPDTAAGYPYIDRGYACLTNGQTNIATNWCGFSDDRPTSAFSYNNLIGFAWDASQDSTSDVWKWPSIWVVLIDPTKLDSCAQGGCVVSKPLLRNANFAFGYGAFATNSRGELGATFLWGGGEFKQSCGIGILNSAGVWDLANIAQSDRFTDRARAGDYSGLTAGASDGSWTSACMTLEAQNDLDTPGTAHFATFGRRADLP